MKRKLIIGVLSGIASFNSYAVDDTELWENLTLLQLQTVNLQQEIIQAQNELKALKLADESLKSEVGAIQKQIGRLDQRIEQLNLTHMVRHHIGEPYLGGIVFYVDESGQHGLIASRKDVTDEGIQWRNGVSGNKVTNAKSDGIAAGENNTRLIIAQQTIDNQKGQFAALAATQFQVSEDGMTPCKTPIAYGEHCHSGWYLPSAYELQLLYRHLHQNNLVAFAPEFYWTSTEKSASEAWLINFSTGELIASSKSNTVGRVRAVARF